jgi:hypothetical protein
LALNAPPSPISLAGSTLGQSIALELGLSATGQISINDTLVRQLGLKPTPGSQISFSDFYNRATFQNGNFANGFTDWNIIDGRIYLGGNGGNTTILGCPTPSDPTAPSLDAGIIRNTYGLDTFRQAIQTNGGVGGGQNWAELEIQRVLIEKAGGVMYGPAIVSAFPVFAQPGDRVRFDWAAFSSLSNASAGDAFNIYSYMVDPLQTCKRITLIDATAAGFTVSQPWTRVTRTIGSSEGGSYYFVFISGTYDSTFGYVVGSRLGVTNIVLEKAGTF